MSTVTINPVAMLYALLTDSVKGMAVTADDSVQVLTPQMMASGALEPASEVYVKMDPYPQEREIGLPIPLVVVGPRVGPRKFTPFPGYLLSEVLETVEVRVMARDIDVPFRVSGDLVRSKLLENINSVVQANHYDPDGSHVYQYIAVSDPGRDLNEPQGAPLYKSAMAVECSWYE